jgi:hypothetical protein
MDILLPYFAAKCKKPLQGWDLAADFVIHPQTYPQKL